MSRPVAPLLDPDRLARRYDRLGGPLLQGYRVLSILVGMTLIVAVPVGGAMLIIERGYGAPGLVTGEYLWCFSLLLTGMMLFIFATTAVRVTPFASLRVPDLPALHRRRLMRLFPLAGLAVVGWCWSIRFLTIGSLPTMGFLAVLPFTAIAGGAAYECLRPWMRAQLRMQAIPVIFPIFIPIMVIGGTGKRPDLLLQAMLGLGWGWTITAGIVGAACAVFALLRTRTHEVTWWPGEEKKTGSEFASPIRTGEVRLRTTHLGRAGPLHAARHLIAQRYRVESSGCVPFRLMVVFGRILLDLRGPLLTWLAIGLMGRGHRPDSALDASLGFAIFIITCPTFLTLHPNPRLWLLGLDETARERSNLLALALFAVLPTVGLAVLLTLVFGSTPERWQLVTMLTSFFLVRAGWRGWVRLLGGKFGTQSVLALLLVVGLGLPVFLRGVRGGFDTVLWIAIPAGAIGLIHRLLISEERWRSELQLDTLTVDKFVPSGRSLRP